MNPVWLVGLDSVERDILLKGSNLEELAVDMSDIINTPGILGALSTELAID